MPSGGSRSRSGPPPDPNALRRDRDEGDWKILPIGGREGEPPPFPLPGQTQRERDIWRELWSMPQAIMWEKHKHHREVALYTRRLREAEKPNATAAICNLAHRMADSLGLTEAGLARNKWMIDVRRTPVPGTAPEVVEQRPTGTTRGRFTVVPGGGS